jgi:hypothetical protein
MMIDIKGVFVIRPSNLAMRARMDLSVIGHPLKSAA